jgi:hypothetical protein
LRFRNFCPVALWQSQRKAPCAEESPNIAWQDAEQGFRLGNTSSGEQKQFCLDRAVQQKAYRHVLTPQHAVRVKRWCKRPPVASAMKQAMQTSPMQD